MAGPKAPVIQQGNATLVKAAGLVTQAEQDLRRLSRNLNDEINGLQGRWNGAGGQAFFQLHNAWQEKHALIVAALNKFSDSLVETDKDNKNTDQRAGDGMTQLMNKLGDVRNH